MNKVIIKGNLTRDPESRVTPDGRQIANFGIGCNRVFTTKEGEKKEEVTFVDITAFGKKAETIQKYFSKGMPILIDGRLKQESWKDKTTGNPRSKLGIILDQFDFCGDNREKTNSAAKRPKEEAEEDVPF